MNSIGACGLLRIDGDLSGSILRKILEPLAERGEISYCIDLVLPTSSEATEEAAWLGMMRLLSIRVSLSGFQVIVHQYSPLRTLIAVACAEEIARRPELEALLREGMDGLIEDSSSALIPEASIHWRDVGTSIDFDGSRCVWDGGRTVPDSLLAFISAAVVGQYMLSGHPTTGIDILLPESDGAKGLRICSLRLTASMDRTIGDIRQQVSGLASSNDASSFTNSPQNATVVILGDSRSPRHRIHGAAWAATLIETRTVGPWRIRLNLSSVPNESTIECIGIFTPAAILLPELYRVVQTKPETTIRQLTHLLESSHGSASGQSAKSLVYADKSPHRHGGPIRKPITVATLTFGDLPYVAHSHAINEAYCNRHGYEYGRIVPPATVERHPVWYKVKGVERLLEDSEFVMFLDADAYFYDHEKTIELLISDHMGESALMLGTDRRDENFTFSDEDGNTGVFIVRNCPEGFAILREWWEAPLSEQGSEWLWRWPVEQSVLNRYVRKGKHSNAVRLIHYSWMNGRDGTYVRHLVGTPEEDRLTILRGARDHLSTLIL